MMRAIVVANPRGGRGGAAAADMPRRRLVSAGVAAIGALDRPEPDEARPNSAAFAPKAPRQREGALRPRAAALEMKAQRKDPP